MDQIHLPLWSRVIFVDWNGVLSDDVFWASIRGKSTHPLHSAMNVAAQTLFHENFSKFESWMRGEVDIANIVSGMGVLSKDRRFPDVTQYLIRRAHEDCIRMRVREHIVKIIRGVRHSCFIVLATDNTDLFHNTVHYLRIRENTRDRENITNLESFLLRNIVRDFDDVLCSSSLGVLKRERPEIFFGDWLAARGMPFSSAILLDDSVENCEAFTRSGGAAIQIPKNPTEAVSETIKLQLDRWLHDI